MLSGIYSVLQKNADLYDFFTIPSCFFFLVISSLGNQKWVSEYRLDDLMWLNLTDVGSGIVFQQCRRPGQIADSSLMDKILYVFFQA